MGDDGRSDRGAYRHPAGQPDAIDAPTVEPPELALEEAYQDLDRHPFSLISCVSCTLVAAEFAVLAGIAPRFGHDTDAAGFLAGLALLSGLFALLQARHLRYQRAPCVQEVGEICLRRRAWRFVAKDGASYQLYPSWKRAELVVPGPSRAWVIPELRAALWWHSNDTDGGISARQHLLDQHCGTSPSERAAFALDAATSEPRHGRTGLVARTGVVDLDDGRLSLTEWGTGLRHVWRSRRDLDRCLEHGALIRVFVEEPVGRIRAIEHAFEPAHLEACVEPALDDFRAAFSATRKRA